MKTIPISEATLNAVIQYLASCPYAQVEQLIQAIKIDIDAARRQESPEQKDPKMVIPSEKKRR